jgi:putative transcriptional regulator
MVLPSPDNEPQAEAETYLRELREGALLLARDELQDPNFQGTLVLMCMYDKGGAVGLVVNRPSHMPLSEVFNVDVPQRSERRKIYIGGPVQQDAMQILQVTDTPVHNAFKVAPEVYLGGEWESLAHILEADQSCSRLFLGYSGWGPGQLEAEINLGAWEVYNVRVRDLLMQDDTLRTGTVSQLRDYLLSLQ